MALPAGSVGSPLFETEADMDEAGRYELLSRLHRGVLVTRRRSGELQTSPIVGATDDEGRFLISSRETAFKVMNLRRDARATLCLFVDEFFGGWVQIEGTADIVALPGAMDALIATYRRIGGEHPDWDEYRTAMIGERRVIIAVDVKRIGPVASG